MTIPQRFVSDFFMVAAQYDRLDCASADFVHETEGVDLASHVVRINDIRNRLGILTERAVDSFRDVLSRDELDPQLRDDIEHAYGQLMKYAERSRLLGDYIYTMQTGTDSDFVGRMAELREEIDGASVEDAVYDGPEDGEDIDIGEEPDDGYPSDIDGSPTRDGYPSDAIDDDGYPSEVTDDGIGDDTDGDDPDAPIIIAPEPGDDSDDDVGEEHGERASIRAFDPMDDTDVPVSEPALTRDDVVEIIAQTVPGLVVEAFKEVMAQSVQAEPEKPKRTRRAPAKKPATKRKSILKKTVDDGVQEGEE